MGLHHVNDVRHDSRTDFPMYFPYMHRLQKLSKLSVPYALWMPRSQFYLTQTFCFITLNLIMTEASELVVIGIVATSSLLLLSCVVTTHTAVSLYQQWNKSFSHKKVTSVLTMISITCFALCMVWCVAFSCWPLYTLDDLDPLIYAKATLWSGYVTFTIGRSTMFLLFLGVIHYTFKDTAYDYPLIVKICYLIPAVIVPLVIIGCSAYDRWIYYDLEFFRFRRYLDHGNTVILCLYSTVLFCRVLGAVALRQLRENDDFNGKTNGVSRLMHSITKTTILVMVVIFFTLCVIVMDELTWS